MFIFPKHLRNIQKYFSNYTMTPIHNHPVILPLFTWSSNYTDVSLYNWGFAESYSREYVPNKQWWLIYSQGNQEKCWLVRWHDCPSRDSMRFPMSLAITALLCPRRHTKISVCPHRQPKLRNQEKAVLANNIVNVSLNLNYN